MSASTTDELLSPRVLVGVWCDVIVQRLGAFGVTDVVISPGSRSTPLTVSALRTPELRCHSVLDERSAGFFALGLARGSLAPVALICTSGTAGAHYFPAVIEASYDGLPLVVVTADRPDELQNCGAPQTIQQVNLYGAFVRAGVSLGAPNDAVESFADLGQTLNAVLRQATGARPGPVHLNVPLRKPLEPDKPRSARETMRVDMLVAAVPPPLGSPPETGKTLNRIDAAPLREVALARRAARRPLVTVGPLPPEDLKHFQACAALLQAPILAEYGPTDSAGLEFIGPGLLEAAEPDLIVHFGPPAVSSAWARYLEVYDGRYFVFSGTEFRDPSRQAEEVVVASLQEVRAALEVVLAEDIEPFEEAPDFVAPLRQRAREALCRALSTSTEGARLSEPGAVVAALSSCRSGQALILGNSLSLRLASWVWPTFSEVPHPYTARGVNGIDGMISWSLGVAEAVSRPTLAVMGDVTAAHDIGSLQLLGDRTVPLVLLVLDNSGGRLFDHLPVRSSVTDEEMRFWTTTPRVDFLGAAAAFGVRSLRVSTETELRSAVAEALGLEFPTLIVVPTDPNPTSAFLAQVRESVSL